MTRRRFHIPAGLQIYPIAILVAIVFVAFSRAIDFHPGLIYGFVGGYTLLSSTRRPDKQQQAIIILMSTGMLLVLIVSAFYLRSPIHDAMRDEGFWISLADKSLAGVFVGGLEGLLFALVPLTFMDGARVIAWSRWIWVVVFTGVTFLFYHIIINKNDTLGEAVGDVEVIMMWGLLGFFAIVSLVTWSYFRWCQKPLPEP